jgi:hypothetical protein
LLLGGAGDGLRSLRLLARLKTSPMAHAGRTRSGQSGAKRAEQGAARGETAAPACSERADPDTRSAARSSGVALGERKRGRAVPARVRDVSARSDENARRSSFCGGVAFTP